jgi:Ser-tRNA(Ala) deacylase AlaX
MCLKIDFDRTITELKKSKDEFVFYKVLEKVGNEFITPYQQVAVASKTLKAVERQCKNFTLDEIYDKSVDNGIHVCTLKEAQNIVSSGKYHGSKRVVFKCLCKRKHLIAFGNDNDAVFTQISLVGFPHSPVYKG